MKATLSYLCAFTCCSLLCACHGRGAGGTSDKQAATDAVAHPASPQLVYYDYGGPPEPYFHKAQIEVLKRYGVGYAGFGCVITDSLAKAVPAHNDSVFAVLQPKYPGFNQDELLAEMQDYVTTQKAIEGTIAPYLNAKIRRNADSSFYYPDINWQAMDTPAKNFYVRVFPEERLHGDRQGPVLEMKVNPATGDMLVKNQDGQWIKYTQ